MTSMKLTEKETGQILACFLIVTVRRLDKFISGEYNTTISF